MFDVGFWELLLIGVVALLVLGPERLPGVARTAGRWIGRARRYVSAVKADIDREIRAEELQKILAKQNEFSKGAYDIVEEAQKGLDEAVSTLNRPDPGLEPRQQTTATPAPSPPATGDQDKKDA